MSNMLYACSIMYKTKLPFIIVFNKEDEQDAQFAREWMEDFEVFQEALQGGNATDQVDVGGQGQGRRRGTGQEGEASYMNSLVNSMALLLEEFYNNIRVSRRCPPSSPFAHPRLPLPLPPPISRRPYQSPPSPAPACQTSSTPSHKPDKSTSTSIAPSWSVSAHRGRSSRRRERRGRSRR